jgi:hypothetical protein
MSPHKGNKRETKIKIHCRHRLPVCGLTACFGLPAIMTKDRVHDDGSSPRALPRPSVLIHSPSMNMAVFSSSILPLPSSGQCESRAGTRTHTCPPPSTLQLYTSS